jgi:hypothetical protein
MVRSPNLLNLTELFGFGSYGLSIRDRSRFFDQLRHQTTNASIENKHFFTK